MNSLLLRQGCANDVNRHRVQGHARPRLTIRHVDLDQLKNFDGCLLVRLVSGQSQHRSADGFRCPAQHVPNRSLLPEQALGVQIQIVGGELFDITFLHARQGGAHARCPIAGREYLLNGGLQRGRCQLVTSPRQAGGRSPHPRLLLTDNIFFGWCGCSRSQSGSWSRTLVSSSCQPRDLAIGRGQRLWLSLFGVAGVQMKLLLVVLLLVWERRRRYVVAPMAVTGVRRSIGVQLLAVVTATRAVRYRVVIWDLVAGLWLGSSSRRGFGGISADPLKHSFYVVGAKGPEDG